MNFVLVLIFLTFFTAYYDRPILVKTFLGRNGEVIGTLNSSFGWPEI